MSTKFGRVAFSRVSFYNRFSYDYLTGHYCTLVTFTLHIFKMFKLAYCLLQKHKENVELLDCTHRWPVFFFCHLLFDDGVEKVYVLLSVHVKRTNKITVNSQSPNLTLLFSLHIRTNRRTNLKRDSKQKTE